MNTVICRICGVEIDWKPASPERHSWDGREGAWVDRLGQEIANASRQDQHRHEP